MLASWKVRVIYLSFVILMLICIIGISIISFFSFLVSTDAIRLRLARELSAWTGYNIELHQPLHFSFFPLKASLSDVLLEDDNNSHLMSAERIEVDLSISDALIGRLRFSETRIIHPRLMIDEPIKTVSGFFISLAHSEGRLGIAIRKVQELSNIDKLTELPAQPFGRILVKDATLIYPLSFGKTAKIANINAMIDWPDLKGSAVFKASGNWNREFVSLTIKADKALLLIGGGMSPLGLSLHSNYGDINFNGSAGILQQKNLNGHFTLHLSGWEQSLRWIKMEKILPNQRGTPLVWESSLEVSSEHISLNHIAFTLGKDKARGAIEVLFRKNLPMITGSLAFEKLDCNSIINALDDPIMINFSFLERFALDLRFSTGNTTIDSLNIENVAASIQMHDGLFVFDIGNATIFGGVVQLNVQLQRNKRFLKELEGRFSVENLNLELLQKKIFRKEYLLTSTTSLILTLRSTFSRWEDLLQDMHGHFSCVFNSGFIKNFNIDDFLEKIRTKKEFFLQFAGDQSFSFDQVKSNAVIRNGKIKLDEATLRFGKEIIDLSGSMNYFEDTLELVGFLNHPHTLNGLCIDTPCILQGLLPVYQFFIKGSLMKPKVFF